MEILGIDVGGTGIKSALVETATGELLDTRQRIATPRPATPAAVAEALRALIGHHRWQGPIGMGLCSTLLGLTLGAVQPMVLSLLHEVAPPARQGEAMALRSLTMNASSFAMPLLFGSIGAVTGTAGLFWIVAGVLGVGARAVPGLRNVTPRAPGSSQR